MVVHAVAARGLSKRYRIGRRAPKRNLRETLMDSLQSSLRSLSGRGGVGAQDQTIWALRDVTFDVAEGEVLGIVGANGAGKSTLLKILSRITDPTEGTAELHGRVGSLLEVGTGFHSELTGRENVFLNGAILGMTRGEIATKFDEIVAFSEVEEFLDTPVKRYSSGMHMRLAFAVAAHLEPEILIVDEVLAVGDAAFQRKCLGKMGSVARGGRTVLFVSHNLGAVQGLCDRVLWLEGGRIRADGPPGEVLSAYAQAAFASVTERTWVDDDAPGDDVVRLVGARVRRADERVGEPLTVRTPFLLEFDYRNLRPGALLSLAINLYNEQGTLVFNAGATGEERPRAAGLFRDACRVPGDLLNDGVYWVELLVVQDQGRKVFRQNDLLVFEVHDSPELRGWWFGRWAGVVRPILPWATEVLDPRPSAVVGRARGSD